MSAPGLDISIMQQLQLPPSVKRSSVNFMGCYAAIHALKMADNICRASAKEKVLIVCTELCTIHFQKTGDMDSIASALLFADGSAAALVTADDFTAEGLTMDNFYSEVALNGQEDMAIAFIRERIFNEAERIYPAIIENRHHSIADQCFAVCRI